MQPVVEVIRKIDGVISAQYAELYQSLKGLNGLARRGVDRIQSGERWSFAMPIPLRADFNAGQLRALARRTKDAPQARRLLALAAVYNGGTRTEAAKIGGVTLQIVRHWVMKFNGQGPLASSTASRPASLRG